MKLSGRNRTFWKRLFVWLCPTIFALPSAGQVRVQETVRGRYAGSVSCRQCHERFYELWAPSHHGLAMQPYTAKFADSELIAQERDIEIGSSSFRAFIGAGKGYIREDRLEGEKRYRIAHVLGGENVYYFLTPMERGHLQTLPVAYDVRNQRWFDTAASAVRHFPGVESDRPVHWTDPLYTFNTSCYACHVSQLSRNYDPKTDTYRTEWAEPGINCETCHGPADEHVRAYRETEETNIEPNDLGLISTGTFSVGQMNSMCNSCHAKMSPITASFTPGERYFGHFDLVTLEHPDFHPDGRDLGENYTMTGWRMSPCAKSGQLDCMHCHTSSGRYRFKNAQNPNTACSPRHAARVENATAHTHHQVDSTGNRCVACHMPMTDFARMSRSDHSMRPPTPAATLRFKSPNACNICHEDEDAEWADRQVRQWHEEDYQEAVLELAGLVDAARRGKWDRLGEMLAYVSSAERDEVFAASLIRLLRACESEAKWPVVIETLEEDASPLMRAAAAEASFRKALALDPNSPVVHLNLGMLLAELNRPREAEHAFRTALKADPNLAAAAYNLGVLLAEDRPQESLKWCRQAFRLRPNDAKYGHACAFFLHQRGQTHRAIAVLEGIVNRAVPSADAYAFLASIHLQREDREKAIGVYRAAQANERLDPRARSAFKAMMLRLQQ